MSASWKVEPKFNRNLVWSLTILVLLRFTNIFLAFFHPSIVLFSGFIRSICWWLKCHVWVSLIDPTWYQVDQLHRCISSSEDRNVFMEINKKCTGSFNVKEKSLYRNTIKINTYSGRFLVPTVWSALKIPFFHFACKSYGFLHGNLQGSSPSNLH